MNTVKSVVTHRTNSLLSIIPGGLTKQLQPADISWNKPFKSYRKLYDEWMATGEKSFTLAGNMHPPPKPTGVQWVKTAWDAVSADIRKYFRVCGISLKPDGSEDDEMRCIQPVGVAFEARDDIREQSSGLAQTEQEDPFDGLEDEDEHESNEVVVDDTE